MIGQLGAVDQPALPVKSHSQPKRGNGAFDCFPCALDFFKAHRIYIIVFILVVCTVTVPTHYCFSAADEVTCLEDLHRLRYVT